MWTREEAFWVIERLEPELAKIGAHCALNGSVAYKGKSKKDLDLIIYPHNSRVEPWDKQPVKELLVKFFRADQIKDCLGISQVRDLKEVAWLKTPKGKRIDFFFLE